jgi:3-oxoacyl-[acyl-carrier-protein] synthase II
MMRGESGIGKIVSYDTAGYYTHQGGELRGFDPGAYMDAQCAKQTGKTAQLAIAATTMAIQDAGIDLSCTSAARTGVSLGTTSGEQLLLEELIARRMSGGNESVPRRMIPQYPSGMIAAHVASSFGVEGTVVVIPTACAAGNYAIGYAYDLIRKGTMDIMLAGGAESFSRVPVCGFNRLFSIDPEACRPFDRKRKGIIPSEGAAMLVLETEESARKRSAGIYAAYQMTKPEPDGDSGYRAIRTALQNARIPEEVIGYINAHGTGTPANDSAETVSIKKAFGRRAYRIPVSSIKSMIGHSFGAAGAIEAASCAMVLQEGMIPPTINYEDPDPECDLDYVPNAARQLRVDFVLSNAYGFGGNDSALILGRYA